jgi:phosphohistidine phosphatase
VRLYFFRHARAEEREDWAGGDSTRPLIEEGHRRTRVAADFIKTLNLKWDAIVTSPYARARQTAEILAEGLGLEKRLFQDDRLEPGFSAREVVGLLQDHRDKKAICLVGHEPDFSEVISDLIGGGRIQVKKGSLIRVDLEAGQGASGNLGRLPLGELIWLLTPRTLEGRGSAPSSEKAWRANLARSRLGD